MQFYILYCTIFFCLFICYLVIIRNFQHFTLLQDDPVDPSLQFLPASDAKKVKKKKFFVRAILVIILVILAAVTALLTGLLVWNFHCEYSPQTICRSIQNWLYCWFLKLAFLSQTVRTDVRIKKVFAGSLTVANRRFTDSYEDSSSAQFNELASHLSRQVSHIYPDFIYLYF